MTKYLSLKQTNNHFKTEAKKKVLGYKPLSFFFFFGITFFYLIIYFLVNVSLCKE